VMPVPSSLRRSPDGTAAGPVVDGGTLRTRRRCSATPSHNPTRSPTRAAASRSRAISSVRKFSVTNSCRLRPISFLRLGMIAVCGTGSPSGCRNSAVTANQSANAPTMAASAAVLT